MEYTSWYNRKTGVVLGLFASAIATGVMVINHKSSGQSLENIALNTGLLAPLMATLSAAGGYLNEKYIGWLNQRRLNQSHLFYHTAEEVATKIIDMHNN